MRWKRWGSRRTGAAGRARKAPIRAAWRPAGAAAPGAGARPPAKRREAGSAWDGGPSGCGPSFGGHFQSDAAIADEAARLVEHRLPAHLEFLLRAIKVAAVEDEIEERAALGDALLQRRALGLVPAFLLDAAGVSGERADPDAEHVEHRARHLGEVPRLVLLPVPVAGQLREAAITGFALAQLGSAFVDPHFQQPGVTLELLVGQPHFEDVADARAHFHQVEGLADEIPCARLQRAQLVAGLRRDHQHGEIAVGLVG